MASEELAERGFALINEADPLALHFAVQRTQPFTAQHPVVVVTPGPLNELPYDLWQQGYRVAKDDVLAREWQLCSSN